MFELKKVCDAFEQLSAAERELLLAEKSLVVLAKLRALSVPGIQAVDLLAGFIIGSVVADDKINETEYLLIYPALVRAFGDSFDFAAIKDSFQYNKWITDYTAGMVSLLRLVDEELTADIITLCLCITSLDKKITGKERRYLRRLCEQL